VSFPEIFQAAGGGTVGLLATLLVLVVSAYYWDLKAQNRDLKAENKEMRATLSRLTDILESWTPDSQKKRLRQS